MYNQQWTNKNCSATIFLGENVSRLKNFHEEVLNLLVYLISYDIHRMSGKKLHIEVFL